MSKAINKIEDFLTNKSTLLVEGVLFLMPPVVALAKSVVDAVTHVANDDELQLINDNLAEVYSHPAGATTGIVTIVMMLGGLYLKDHPLKRDTKPVMTIMADNKDSMYDDRPTLAGFLDGPNAFKQNNERPRSRQQQPRYKQ